MSGSVLRAQSLLGILSLSLKINKLKKMDSRGAWVAQCPTLAQVMISQPVGSSLVLGSVLTAQSWELLCLPLSLPLPDSRSVSLSL